MGKNERQAYLKAIRSRYRRARKKVKVTILDEFCFVCGYNRKYAIRRLSQRVKTLQFSQTPAKFLPHFLWLRMNLMVLELVFSEEVMGVFVLMYFLVLYSFFLVRSFLF